MNKLFTNLLGQDLMIPILGICPLLIVTTNTINGLAIGLCCLLALILTSFVISCLRNLIPYDLRLVIILFVSATLVTVLNLGMQIWFYELSLALGMYMPLIAINCLVLSSAEEFSLRNNITQSFLNSLRLGSGLVVLLLIVGVLREISGFGSVLQQADLLFGESASSWKIELLNGELKFAVFKLAPGAFIILGLVLAFKNFMETRTGHSMS